MPIPGCQATSYSTCIAPAVLGAPQYGLVHSVFDAAANILFPQNFILSLNSTSSPRMPNGLQLSPPSATFPFPNLRPGMLVLFGAQRLHIEAISCSLDLSLCPVWNPHIKRPENPNQKNLTRNAQWLAEYTSNWQRPGQGEPGRGPAKGVQPPPLPYSDQYSRPVYGRGAGCTPLAGPRPGVPRSGYGPSHSNLPDILSLARHLCGRGPGLTPTGDDILAGWMAVGWLLHGPTPNFLEICQQIVNIAKQQTHLLSQCWLQHAAQGNVAEPIGTLLTTMTQNDDAQLEHTTQIVLSMGATSGYDIIQGILLHFTSIETV